MAMILYTARGSRIETISLMRILIARAILSTKGAAFWGSVRTCVGPWEVEPPYTYSWSPIAPAHCGKRREWKLSCDPER